MIGTALGLCIFAQTRIFNRFMQLKRQIMDFSKVAFCTILLLLIPSNSFSSTPYKLDLKMDAPLLGGGIGFYAFGQWRVSQLDPYRDGSFSKDDLLPWDRPFAGTWNSRADLASDILCVGGVLPFVISGVSWKQGNLAGNEVLTQVVMFSEVMVIQSGINLTVRSAEVWPRPFVFSRHGGSERSSAGTSGSFYSGHASGAFAAATFTGVWFDHTYPQSPWSKWVWTGTMGTAVAISGLRVAAGKHYPTDVVVGALVGSSIGWLVPWLHETNAPMKIAPQPGGAIAYVNF